MMKKLGMVLLVIAMSWGITACTWEDVRTKLGNMMDEMDIVVDPATINSGRQPQSNAAERETQSASAQQETSETDQETTTSEYGMRMRVTAGESEVIFELNDTSAAISLYRQLPLTVNVEDNGNNEKIFSTAELSCTDVIDGDCLTGTLAYNSQTGSVVMHYGSASDNSGLYLLGEAIEGAGNISSLTGTVEITKAD